MAIPMINLPDEDNVDKPAIDEITLASEASLAEAWLSPEDDHWDDFYKELSDKEAS